MSESFQPKLKIYVVEDGPEFRERLLEFIADGDAGAVVGWADTEEQAVADILWMEPDVVILDVQLRVGNGLDVLSKLRAALGDSMPMVIMLTDYAFAQFSRYAVTNGASYFLDKASDMKQLETLLGLFNMRLQMRGRISKSVGV